MTSKEFFERVIYIFFPRRCNYCGQVVLPSMAVCDDCINEIYRIDSPSCNKCGVEKEFCECKGKRRAFRSIIAPFYYTGALRTALHRFKFRGTKDVADTLAEEMIECIKREYSEIKFDVVTCVPLTKASLKKRQYNQSALLAERISAALEVPFNPNILVKLYDTPAQHTLKAAERAGNVFGVFDVTDKNSVEGKTVLLCDDIKTTGSTLNECSKMLIAYDAAKVYCVCAAITRNFDKLTNDID